jgi:hypothetical protein
MMTVLIALLTGLVGMVLAFLVADPITKAYHVSNMEGGRAMLMVFVYAPAGFLLGAVTGIILARTGHVADFAGFAKAQGMALLITAGVIGGAGGIAWLAADRPPRLNGKAVGLELEVRMPMDTAVANDLHAAQFHVSVYENTRYNRFAQLDLDHPEVRDGYLVVKGTASLFTRNFGRSLAVGMDTDNSAVFELRLSGSPRSADTAWTEWLKPDGSADPGRAAGERQYEVRYRAVSK